MFFWNVEHLPFQMKQAGIEILEKQERQLTEEEAREFYAHKQDEVGYVYSPVYTIRFNWARHGAEPGLV